jgi:hypothetical protein
VRTVTVMLDDSKIRERDARNNRPFFKMAGAFVEQALIHNSLAGTVTLRPIRPATLSIVGQVETGSGRGPLKFKYKPTGGGSAWEYDVVSKQILVKDLCAAITNEIAVVTPKPQVDESPLRCADVVRGAMGLKPPRLEPKEDKSMTARPASSSNNDTIAMATIMDGVMKGAVQIEEWRHEIAEKRKSLASMRQEHSRLHDAIKRAEDDIANIELQMESNPDARRAESFLDAMAKLLKSRA